MNTDLQRFFLVLLIIFLPLTLMAEEAIQARSTGSRINVRVRPDVNSEIVTQLSLDEEVEVLEQGPEWTKIKAPHHSRCWVHSDYIEKGRIKGTSVNLRCGPGIAFPVLCKLYKGAYIKEVDRAGDWIRIEVPVEFSVWVNSQYLELAELSEVKVKEEVLEPEEPLVSPEPEPVLEPEVPTAVSVPSTEIPKLKLVSYAGHLEDLGIIINRPGTYKLVSSSGKWICILKSPTLDINPYVKRIVRVEGVVVAIASTWKVPVIELKRLQVIE